MPFSQSNGPLDLDLDSRFGRIEVMLMRDEIITFILKYSIENVTLIRVHFLCYCHAKIFDWLRSMFWDERRLNKARMPR